jgi:hypothetical protein
VPSRQEAPHLHQAILDPTQQYLLVPDLGADLVRVYSIDQKTNILTAKTPLKAKAGSGPRHAAFTYDPIAGHYVFYLAQELAVSVTAYRVTYEDALGGLKFDEIGVYSTLAPGEPLPATTTGESTGVTSEITIGVSVATVSYCLPLLPSPSAPPPSPAGGVTGGPAKRCFVGGLFPYFASLSHVGLC